MNKNRTICAAVTIIVLMVTALGWGYGISGVKDSADFVNFVGPISSSWAYEGGVIGDPLADTLGNKVFSYYPDGTVIQPDIVSDGNIVTMTYSGGSNTSFYCWYKNMNGSWPDPNEDTGLTVEWRSKVHWLGIGYPAGVNSGLMVGLGDGKYLFSGVIREYPEYGEGFPLGKITLRNYDPDGTTQIFPNSEAYITDISEFHTYRLAILGNDGEGTRRANWYVDGTLVASEVAGSLYEWPLLFGGWVVDWTDVRHSCDYIRVDTTGGYAPLPQKCGDAGYLDSDINKDCLVNLADFAMVGEQWLLCSNPADPTCLELPWIYEDFSAPAWNFGNFDVINMRVAHEHYGYDDGWTNDWKIERKYNYIGGGVVYNPSYDPVKAACLYGKYDIIEPNTTRKYVGQASITRNIGEAASGSVSFGYTNITAPDFGGKVILRVYDADIFTINFGTALKSGSDYRGYIKAGTTNILLPAGDLPSTEGNVIKIKFDFTGNGISNIDVRSDSQDWNHALVTSIQFGDTIPYIDQIKFVGITAKNVFNAGDTNYYTCNACIGRGDGEGIAIYVDKNACGDYGQAYLTSDIAPAGGLDCYVNNLDLDVLAQEWLTNNTPVYPPELDLPVIPRGAVSIDGNLSEWGTAAWISLDQDYYGTPTDINSAASKFALKWDPNTAKIYTAVIVKDTSHWFVNGYNAEPNEWTASDRLEVYCQGDNTGFGYSQDYSEAQQYLVGPNASGTPPSSIWGGGVWAVWGDANAIDPDAGFEKAVTVSGDDIIYEVAVTPFDYYATKKGSGATKQTSLSVGKIVRFDLVADSRFNSDPNDFGMKSANLYLDKSYLPPVGYRGEWHINAAGNASSFERYRLGD